MPASFVKFDIELEGSRFVSTRRTGGVSIVVDAGIGIGRAGFARQTIEHKVGRSAVWFIARMQTLFVVDHCRNFRGRSGFGKLLGNGSYQFLTEVETVLNADGGAANDDVSW